MIFSLLLTLCFVDGPTVYGKAPKEETPLISIQTLMANPEAWLDKVVRVEGEVQEVCPMKGCWMDLSADGKDVRIKVKDGEIVFDQKLEGKTVIAEGTVYKFELTKEKAVDYYRHLAEEKGESFDPASVTSGATIYQIGGIGAVTKE